MKTLKLIRASIIILMVICISGISSYAIEPAITPAQHLQKVIKDGITYPAEAVKNCCTGTVAVYFTVDENGKIIIEKTIADNEHIAGMVKEQLSTICCKGVKTPYNEHYKVKITFKLVG